MKYTITIDKVALDNLFKFLGRTNLTGEEVPAFNVVLAALRTASPIEPEKQSER